MSDRLTQEDTPEHFVDMGDSTGLQRVLWSVFSSMRTAVTLLIVLAAASVIGTVIPQNAPAQEYLSYGSGVYATFKALGLTDLYHSGWYQLILLLMGANLVVCSINRFNRTWNQAYHPEITIGHVRMAKMRGSQKVHKDESPDETAEKVRTALRTARYSIREERNGQEVSIYASRGTATLWGRYLAHVSVLVIFLGAIVGNLLGFDGYATIVEGRSTDGFFMDGAKERTGLGFKIALKKFYIEHDKEHNPTAYKSDLQVYEGDKLAVQRVIDVNHPLIHRGVSFFQSDYGIVGFYLLVTGPEGKPVRVPIGIDTNNGPEGKTYVVTDQQPQQIKVGDRNISIFVHDFAPDYVGGDIISASFMPINPAAEVMISDRFPEYKGKDAWSRLGWIPLADSATYKGLRITMESAVAYTGLQVASDPGLPIIYAGFGILLLGVFLSFYVTRTVVRASIVPSPEGSQITIAASSRSGAAVSERAVARLREAID